MTEQTIIATENLTKQYGSVRAVENVSLNVKKGEIYGFLGLNGAGKTTAIRMLLGMIKPTAGAAYINGAKANAGNYRLWEQVGYLVETPCAYPEITVRENLEIFRRLRGVGDAKAVGDIMEKLQLTQYKDRKAKVLSQGNAQRVGLAKALLHKPSLLILDEPTNALDPAGIVEIRELLLGMAKNDHVTVFISSHILGEVSRLADRIGIIHQGRLLQEIQTRELERLCKKRLSVKTGDAEKAVRVLAEKGFNALPAADGTLELADEQSVAHPDAIAAILVNAGLALLRLNVEEENLESYFLRTIGDNGGAKK